MPDVVELPGAPARLLSGTGAAVGLNSYAVVAYIPPPLGAFLNALRRELVPGCDYRSHVTVLPPRPLVGPAAEAWRQFREQARSFAAFEVEIGGVEMFASSQVVYLAVTAGSQPLRRMNLALN